MNKKIKGILYLLATIVWVLLMFPTALALITFRLFVPFLTSETTDLVLNFLNLLVSLGGIAAGIVVIYFGVNLLRSAWRYFNGYDKEASLKLRLHNLARNKVKKNA